MANNTKILRYDLDEELSLVFEQLDKLKAATKQTDLDILFQNITVDMLSKDEKAVVKDLLDAYKSKKKHVAARLQTLEDSLNSLDLYETDRDELFTYDKEDNVETETVKIGGVTHYVQTYTYADAAAGKLKHSEKVFTNKDGKVVTIKKTYTYTGENITGIKTATTVAP